MATLSGSGGRVDLGRGISITAPGLRGSATLQEIPVGATRATLPGGEVPGLDEALDRMDMTQIALVDVEATPVPGVAPDARLRDASGSDALILEVPDLGAEAGQVVLMRDDAGGLSWHFPEDSPASGAPAQRGAGGTRRFVIPNRLPEPAPGAAATRSVFGTLGRKLLKVIVYPVTDFLVGKAASWIAEYWESRRRAYGLRSFLPADYQRPATSTLTAADLTRLAQGRALLFVHGTFSISHSAFHDIAPTQMARLARDYGERLFAFDHYSLSHDPERNVDELFRLLDALKPDAQLEVDVLCHSRGGLVARCLAARSPRIRVRRIVFVGVPNQGTSLAEPDHMVAMIDRLTTALALVPPGGVREFLDGLLTAVKIIGHGALQGLDGLASMNPKGSFLATLNSGTHRGTEMHAIAADYTPQDSGLRSVIMAGANAAVDRIFAGAQNDLVVPEAGVYANNGAPGFPIGAGELLRIPQTAGVMHTTMFGSPLVANRLDAWLP